MCFSAEASFGSSAALIPVGTFCVIRAARGDLRFLPLGMIPIAFGLQQAAEGFVWLGLNRGQPELVTTWSVVYLFFALAFWPIWIPFSLLLPESRRFAKVFLGVLVILSPIWLWLYAPIAAEPERLLSTQVTHHSIAYEFSELPAFQLVPRTFWRILYLSFICLPILFARPSTGGSNTVRLAAGILVAGLFAVCAIVYWYAFTSVWCFFAAILSLLLGVAFWQMPARSEVNHAAISGGVSV